MRNEVFLLRAKYGYFVCKIPLRALGLKAEQAAARPSARATLGYIIYKRLFTRACSATWCIVYKMPYFRARLAERTSKGILYTTRCRA